MPHASGIPFTSRRGGHPIVGSTRLIGQFGFLREPLPEGCSQRLSFLSGDRTPTARLQQRERAREQSVLI